ncbi:MAG: hypothetical protein CUR34_13035 [Sediminibacterium sp.]|nr:MAG: hypothetical protein CUR34_13035 [Sediminibacterium sp.] [Sediminibacterium sp. FEMGT703S]
MNTIGIDFGTGNSVLAEWFGNESKIFEKVGSNGLVCSDVVIDGEGKPLAKSINEINDLSGFKIEKSIKRRLLKAIDSEDEKEIAYLIGLCVCRLKYIFDAYQSSTSEKIAKTVLTCPANTGQAYRTTLMEIGRQIGLPSIDIVDEPTAAAVHHGLTEVAKQNERWMVIDWGCGTCDISMIERKQGSRDLRVVTVEGDNNLGGSDIDTLLATSIADALKINIEQLPHYAAEKIKIELSNKESFSKEIILNNGDKTTITVDRTKLEQLIQPLLIRFKDLINNALQAAGWTDSGVDRIIATGGPVLMPCVKNIITELAEDMGAELNDTDPLTSVAKGAARLAEFKRIGGLVVTNKVAKSIGIRVSKSNNTDVYYKIIQRGEDRPVTRQVELTTSIDLQDVIEIEIREGDNDISAISNTLLAKLNAVVRPETKGNIKLKLQIALNDSGTLEAYIEPISDKSTVREIQAVGIRLEKTQKETVEGELRTDDPISEFKTQAIDGEVDPDTARQIYERLKVKYHPDRQAEKREYWNQKLRELDESFNNYIQEVQKRMYASSVPNLPWNDTTKLKSIIVDEVLAHRLTHCLANNIGDENQLKLVPEILKQFPDYRRVIASYLSGIKSNSALQNLLATDDRPQVGMVVLLQNVQGKSIKEKHEVLKAVYRVKEEKLREFLKAADFNIDNLFVEVPKVADVAKNPITGQVNTVGTAASSFKGKLNYEYNGNDTIITGNTYPVKELIKKAGGRWDPGSSAWKIAGKHVTDKEIFD